ncbi:histidine kinase [Pseudonocardia sediminis]|uniref:Histidine kinase n=1 Tax=Pseudonocardia sediminis TaxID=1397368 RepID=A0A4Q7V3A3_PSEST|nr:histidine kinase [Pseudonocardia sediminis]RZT88595.1 histidine kinase [Pseudonocardia sediminis]
MTLEPPRSTVATPHVVADDARVGWQQWSRRRRLERRLHDGAALRISALTLQLGLFRHRIPEGEADLNSSIDDLQEELAGVLQELREVAGEIYPALLDEAGLGPALREQAGRLDAAVMITAPDERYGPAAEGAAYFALVACLGALPAGGDPVTVSARRAGDALVVVVDGVDPGHAAHFRDGAEPLGGTVDVSPGPRPGTGTITARFPCG